MAGQRDDLLADRYELSGLIAGGAMGQVWRARDTLLDRPVAVKVLREQYAGDPTFRTRFRAEAKHAAVLTHPHIAAVFDYGEVPGPPGGAPTAFLVMELVEGESLAEVLRREPRLGVPRTLDVLRQAAEGLAAAHAAGVVHRDIKPANLLVARDGRVKLTDFGIARSASSVGLTATGQVLGTAHYLSPEQASGEVATPASDVYALGAVAYECLAGRRAFEGESAVQVAVMQIRDHPAPLPDDVPPAVRSLVERAMAKDPSVRFPDGAALRDAVDRVLAGAPVTAGPAVTAVLPALPWTTETPPAPRRRRRWALPVAALLAVLLVVGAVGLVAALRDEEAAPVAAEPADISEPAGIEVLAEAFLGRQVSEVQAELLARGLQVELLTVETGEVPGGVVTGVDPAGVLAPGDVVRVSYAVPPIPIPAPASTPPPAPVDEGGQEDDDEDRDERGRGDADRGDRGRGDGERGERGRGGGRGNGGRGDD
ncbi:Stk1 family PASTA domain-containing Ser/Thr kinase [Blastococcus sp. CCUG 61487]|uniref:Stk1 family PASTA domain-containing Ser/Thr kinase n=1 Tax=Blastococcus sp. CCUG 61487 TaxID=1840703 RepID=UPI001138C767|nr:Stk1 family PASTA domain-containing Ser/Thr kinase [Blastococcus sp. CCUG 61487]TKJ29274.1 serine/threonine protein kinase [Blastococcus sp. CCUG 61487]